MMERSESARLRSLLLMYSFEDHDNYGLRAIVPRAVPLEPPFTPSTLAYNAQVPSDVEAVYFEAPHPPQTQVDIRGNTDLQYGRNAVRLILTNMQTGERVAYNVTVERKKEQGLLYRCAKFGAVTSVVVIGTAVIFQKFTQTNTLSEETEEPKEEQPSKNGFRSWRRKIGSFLEDLFCPFL